MLNADIYNLWFAPIRALSVEEDSVILEVANEFCEVWLKDNYIDLIQDVLMHAAGRPFRVVFQVAPAGANAAFNEKKTRTKLESVRKANAPENEFSFNPKNTFDTFVVGNNNTFAHAAALAVSQTPGKSYNPLFLYGGVGLGKTHLLHAIGQYVVSHRRGARVAYVSSEKFTNEYIDGIQNS